jgi:cell division protein FtsN
MAERRYSFRFSLPEGCVILLSLLLTSFLVFLFGVYVGKEVEAHKAAQQTRTARLPASVSGGPSPARPTTDAPAMISTVPAEKSEAHTVLSSPPVSPAPQNPSSSQSTAAAVAQKKTLPSLPLNSETSATVVPKPQPASPPTPVVSTSGPAPPSSLPPTSAATAAVAPKPKLSSPATPATPVTSVGSEFDAKEKKPTAPSKRWAVQVQATTQEAAAQSVAKQLREQGLSPVISRVERQGEAWYRVRVGKFANEEEAEAIVSRFRREGKFTQAYPVLE